MTLACILEFLKEAAPIGAAIAFVIGIYQYARAQAWKRTEFVAKLFKEFSEDGNCKNARWILEGYPRKIFYEEGCKSASYDYDFNALGAAIERALKREPLSSSEHHMLDSLDVFFLYLKQFEQAIERKLVKQDDVYPYLEHWIGILTGRGMLAPPSPILVRLLVYVQASGFTDVQAFLRRSWT